MKSEKNTLFYGDNLNILREYIPDESVDLIYLDPPFNSNRSYNILFKDEAGSDSEAQITAFDDTWHWNIHTEEIYQEIVTDSPHKVASLIGAMRQAIGTNQMMAYLIMMTVRLVELHRVLKDTGSLYLHCDPTASHYLKIILDTIFGNENFKNEIIWQRINAKGNVQRKFGAVHDSILVYVKNIGQEIWNQQYRPLNESYVKTTYRYIEEKTGRRYMSDNLTASMQRASAGQIYEWKGKKPPPTRCWVYAKDKMEKLDKQGRIIYSKTGYPRFKRYLDENPGEKIPDVWTDINIALGKESLGYPTQKPLALLERIIQASSNKGDMILDPFCGCGTSIAAAEKLKRRWLGIDITHLSIALQKYRLQEMFPSAQFDIIGEPESEGSARQLALDDRFQFQWWALSLVKAKPLGGQKVGGKGKKGADKGIDGIINFIDDSTSKLKRVLIQVKSGKVQSGDIRDLRGTLERENAEIAVFITLEDPTSHMIKEAAEAGFYESPNWDGHYPTIQIFTISQLLQGETIKMPPIDRTFKKAEKVITAKVTDQRKLDL